jgi:PrtD family type I secretion system ABC transporter
VQVSPLVSRNPDTADQAFRAAAPEMRLRDRLNRMSGAPNRRADDRAQPAPGLAEPFQPARREPAGGPYDRRGHDRRSPSPSADPATSPLRARLDKLQDRRIADRRRNNAAAPVSLGPVPQVDAASPANPSHSPPDVMPAPRVQPRRPPDRAVPAADIPHAALDRLQAHAAAVPAADPASIGPDLKPDTAQSTPPGIAPVQVQSRSELRAALDASKRALIAVGWFSCAINVLMLTGPIFMLQVYDRVMTSGSYSTLWVLFGLTVALYAVIGVLEFIRSRVVTRIGVEIDQRIGDRVFEAALRASLSGTAGGSSAGALRELDGLRQFVAGPAPITAFDLAWTPIYLAVIFFTHWTLGVAAVVGMAALLACAWASDAWSRSALTAAGKSALKSLDLAETGQRNAGAITAMGMTPAYRARWQAANRTALSWQVLASDTLGGVGAVTKTLRLLMQSAMLAVGAALALHGDISAGAIIAGTIIFGRALAPVEQVITHWKASAKAIESYQALDQLLQQQPARPPTTRLPQPRGHILVEALRVAAPETKTVILAGVTFEVRPGRVLAVIGPSASGKSTLLRALVGLWPPFGGSIRLDGQKLDQWNPDDLGRHVGYLPQDVELFAGTVRDNIARFRTDVDDQAVVDAAMAAHAHDLILALPKGYETELGAYGAYLSAGQRQRIGLARALFGDPALIVLDEPNANLDRAGDEALSAAIDGMKRRGQAVVLVSHRVQAIGIADDILYLERGQQRAFGPRDEVMRALNGGQASAPPQGERKASGARA